MAERRDDYLTGTDASATAGTGSTGSTGTGRANDGTPDNPEAIRADIRETRERLGDTLEEIGDRLNPKHLTEQVKDNLRDATIGRARHVARTAADRVNDTRYSIMDTIRDNPIPAAMIGIGLAWLLINKRREHTDVYTATSGNADAYRGAAAAGYTSYGSDADYAYAGAPYGGGTSAYAGGASSGATGGAYAGGTYAAGSYGTDADEHESGKLDRARERASDLGHQARDRAGNAAHRARDTASNVADRTKHAASNVADRTRNMASSVADRTRGGARRAEGTFYEQPLVVGAATLALGLAAGMTVPVSDREVRLMGDARDRLVDRARDKAQDTRERVETVVERVAEDAKDTARQAAREEGLTGNA